MKKERINTGGGEGLQQNAFGALEGFQAPVAKELPPQKQVSTRGNKPVKPVRIEVRREKAGRGGKTVTLVRPLEPTAHQMLDQWLAELKTRLGTGGKAVSGQIELQGDQVATVVDYLIQKGHKAFAAN